MTDRKQFEAMLEALINEDHEQAKEIFHNIVVAKSRQIYEELLESDFSAEEEEEESVEEASEEEEEESVEEGKDDVNPFMSDEDSAEEEEEGADEEEEEGDDEEDFGDEEGEADGDIEDRVLDLEDALEDLKAEFEQLLAGEEGEEHGDEFDGDDIGGDDFGGDDLDAEPMMEYVNKVALPKHGDNGVNTKSAVAGKNDMGGTAKNIAQGFSTEKGGTQGGLAKPSTQLQDGGNVNKPGADAGKTAFKKKEPGHGAEKKGTGEAGGTDKKSLIGGKVR